MTRVVLAMAVAASAATGAPAARAAFDKSTYRGTVWSAANPWWLPNKSPVHGSGGPDFAWQRYSDDRVAMWRQVAERCASYGITGLQAEMIIRKAGYIEVLRAMLDGFAQSGTGLKAMPFLTGSQRDPEKAVAEFVALFAKLGPILKSHPAAYRLNGHPVVVLYNATGYAPDAWPRIVSAVERTHGRVIWLVNAAHAKADWLRQVLPHVDGISMYANWSEEGQRALYDWLGPLMHAEFPDKIFEGAVHTTYFVHFHYGGVAPRLTEKYRNSWDITLAAKPDAVTITNWFDTYENSRIMPSYELEDSMLRIAQHRIALWRGKTPVGTDSPDLYVANYTSVLLGQTLDVEVTGFPVKGPDREVTVGVELCTEAGEVAHAFDARPMVLDALRVERFEVASDTLARHRALRPRLVYRWRGTETRTPLLPATQLVTSLRPHVLFWCRSIKRLIKLSAGGTDWTLNGAHPGSTVTRPADGLGVLSCQSTSNRANAREVDRGGGWVRILRNGREIESFGKWDLWMTRLVRLPPAGGALDWYNLELANGNGGRYLSPAIWVTDGRRQGTVTLPIWRSDGAVAHVEVEAARVPYFHYRCDRDTGGILHDRSGYEHHGYLGGKGYGGGHLARTGYRHEHTGAVGPAVPAAAPTWRRGADGKGFLSFDGANYVMIQGGTAFPYASTYECSVRPRATGTRQGILGAPNGQIRLVRLPDGRIQAARDQATEGMGGAKPKRGEPATVTSRLPVPEGRWSHIAAVYDLRHLALYVDGHLQGKAPSAPLRSHEWINALVLGGTCRFPYEPEPSFAGDLRDVRIYGRNLTPAEFLPH